MHNVSTNVTSTVSANVTSTMLSHFDDKKVRYIYSAHSFVNDHITCDHITMIILIAIICYYYQKHRSKQKGIDSLIL